MPLSPPPLQKIPPKKILKTPAAGVAKKAGTAMFKKTFAPATKASPKKAPSADLSTPMPKAHAAAAAAAAEETPDTALTPDWTPVVVADALDRQETATNAMTPEAAFRDDAASPPTAVSKRIVLKQPPKKAAASPHLVKSVITKKPAGPSTLLKKLPAKSTAQAKLAPVRTGASVAELVRIAELAAKQQSVPPKHSPSGPATAQISKVKTASAQLVSDLEPAPAQAMPTAPSDPAELIHDGAATTLAPTNLDVQFTQPASALEQKWSARDQMAPPSSDSPLVIETPEDQAASAAAVDRAEQALGMPDGYESSPPVRVSLAPLGQSAGAPHSAPLSTLSALTDTGDLPAPSAAGSALTEEDRDPDLAMAVPTAPIYPPEVEASEALPEISPSTAPRQEVEQEPHQAELASVIIEPAAVTPETAVATSMATTLVTELESAVEAPKLELVESRDPLVETEAAMEKLPGSIKLDAAGVGTTNEDKIFCEESFGRAYSDGVQIAAEATLKMPTERIYIEGAIAELAEATTSPPDGSGVASSAAASAQEVQERAAASLAAETSELPVIIADTSAGKEEKAESLIADQHDAPPAIDDDALAAIVLVESDSAPEAEDQRSDSARSDEVDITIGEGVSEKAVNAALAVAPALDAAAVGSAAGDAAGNEPGIAAAGRAERLAALGFEDSAASSVAGVKTGESGIEDGSGMGVASSSERLVEEGEQVVQTSKMELDEAAQATTDAVEQVGGEGDGIAGVLASEHQTEIEKGEGAEDEAVVTPAAASTDAAVPAAGVEAPRSEVGEPSRAESSVPYSFGETTDGGAGEKSVSELSTARASVDMAREIVEPESAPVTTSAEASNPQSAEPEAPTSVFHRVPTGSAFTADRDYPTPGGIGPEDQTPEPGAKRSNRITSQPLMHTPATTSTATPAVTDAGEEIVIQPPESGHSSAQLSSSRLSSETTERRPQPSVLRVSGETLPKRELIKPLQIVSEPFPTNIQLDKAKRKSASASHAELKTRTARQVDVQPLMTTRDGISWLNDSNEHSIAVVIEVARRSLNALSAPAAPVAPPLRAAANAVLATTAPPNMPPPVVLAPSAVVHTEPPPPRPSTASSQRTSTATATTAATTTPPLPQGVATGAPAQVTGAPARVTSAIDLSEGRKAAPPSGDAVRTTTTTVYRPAANTSVPLEFAAQPAVTVPRTRPLSAPAAMPVTSAGAVAATGPAMVVQKQRSGSVSSCGMATYRRLNAAEIFKSPLPLKRELTVSPLYLYWKSTQQALLRAP